MEKFSPQPRTLCTPATLPAVRSHPHPHPHPRPPWKAQFEPGKKQVIFLGFIAHAVPASVSCAMFYIPTLHYTQKGDMSNQAESCLHPLKTLPDRDLDKHASPEMTATVFLYP